MSNHRSSKECFELTVLSVFKKTENLISLKEMLPHEQDGFKSNQPLISFKDCLMNRRLTNNNKLELSLKKSGHIAHHNF